MLCELKLYDYVLVVYVDSHGEHNISCNPVYHYIQLSLLNGLMQVERVPINTNPVNMGTKSIAVKNLLFFRSFTAHMSGLIEAELGLRRLRIWFLLDIIGYDVKRLNI